MYVFDEITKQLLPISECSCVVVKHIPGTIIFGYSSKHENIVNVLLWTEEGKTIFKGDKELLKDHLEFSLKRGIYVSTVDFPKDELIFETHVKGQGGFPYTFNRRYEAIESFNIFEGKQKILNNITHPLSTYLKYSFGLEFETSMGFVPEDVCFRDGLIPLRDGSISGLEYSTVILNSNKGLSLLEQQLKTLKKYTSFNKECSLHIHLGGFPLNPAAIFRIYLLCKLLEPDISLLVPSLTFNSSLYKNNEKDYCLRLCSFRDFKHMYRGLVGRPFLGDLTQPHPNDIKREAKWRIPTRRK